MLIHLISHPAASQDTSNQLCELNLKNDSPFFTAPLISRKELFTSHSDGNLMLSPRSRRKQVLQASFIAN